MEHQDLPIYVITYNIEMTQFVFAERKKMNEFVHRMPEDERVELEDHLDHSIAARRHA